MKKLALLLVLFAFPAMADEWIAISTQNLATSATVRDLTTDFGSQTRHVRVTMTTAGYLGFGISSGPPATAATGYYMPAGLPETIKVSPGSNISVILVSGTGILSVTELSK